MGTWNKKANLKFVSLYEQNPCLWKTDCPSYRDRKAREEAINRIVEAMAFPDFKAMECKTKIKNVRSHYIQVLKKIKKSRSATGKPTYEPKLAWFKSLDSFLSPHILTLTKKCRANQSSASSDAQGAGSSSVDAETPPEGTSATWLDPGPDEDDGSAVGSQDDHPSPPSVRLQYAYVDDSDGNLEDRKPRKRMALDVSEAPAPGVEQQQQPPPDHHIAEGMTVNVSPGGRDAELEAFARSVVAQLRNMPFPVALQLQLKIQTLITEERLRLMRSPLD